MKTSYLLFAIYSLIALTVAILGDLTSASATIPAAIILNGILGGGKGKVGGVIMSKWKGIDYVKQYFIPANPNTLAQQTARSNFRASSKFASALMSTIIPKFWDPFAVKMSGFNFFLTTNKGKLSSIPDVGDIDIKITVGNLEAVKNPRMTYNTTTGAAVFTWDEVVISNGLTTDNIAVVVIHKGSNTVLYFNDGLLRDDTTLNFSLNPGYTLSDLLCAIIAYRGANAEFIVSENKLNRAEAPV